MANWKPFEDNQLYGYVRVGAAPADVHPDSARRAAQRHGWAQPHLGVIHLGPETGIALERLAAAVVRVRRLPDQLVALSGWTALWLFGLVANLPTTIEVTIEHGRRAAKVDRVRVRRSRALVPERIVVIDQLPVLGIPWLLIEMAGRVEEGVLRGWLLDVRHRKLATFEEVRAALDTWAPVRGSGVLRRLLTELDPEASDSTFEDLARARLRAAGFKPDPGHAEVWTASGRREIDIPFSAEQVGIECHSMGHHSSREDLERDAERQTDLAIAGWTLVIMTWRDLGAGWESFAARLRRALARSRAEGKGDHHGTRDGR